MDLTYEDVSRILTLVDTMRGEDVTFSIGGRRITLTSRKPQPVAASQAATRPALGPGAARQPTGLVDVRASELGYFRRSPGLEVGARVSEGDTLGEMVGRPPAPGKAVRAPASGRIVELCVAEDDFIEYGQVLLTLDAAAGAPGETPHEQGRGRPRGRPQADPMAANE